MKIDKALLDRAFAHLRRALEEEVGVKGDMAFNSLYEAFGSITEEYHELLGALHKKDLVEFHDEAIDVAIAAIWAVASLLGYWENTPKAENG